MGNARRRETMRRSYYKFSQSGMSVVGLVIVVILGLAAAFAPWVAPYPHHAGLYIDFSAKFEPPSLKHPCGTDGIGRDVLSRIIFGFRSSLFLGIAVTLFVMPLGTVLGLLAGYHTDRWSGTLVMRITDVFLSLPPLVLALTVASVLPPSIWNGILALSMASWPWYTRMVYSRVTSLRNEPYILRAKLAGIGTPHILFKELLPNCASQVITKMTLEMGSVVLMGATLSFVGLGEKPPSPGLGTMLADGAQYLPVQWWLTVFPGVAILLIVVGFNLLGDGLRDLYGGGDT